MAGRGSAVVAVVLVGDQPQLLQDCLDALSNQEVKPDRVVVLDVRPHANTSPLQEPAALGLEVSVLIAEGDTGLGAVVAMVRDSIDQESDFIWVLREDSIPAPAALRVMLHEFEMSPSLGQVAPKLLHRDQSRRIFSLGLTSSRFGDFLRRHSDEYDQGQFDSDSDVLAASPLGSVFRRSNLAELNSDERQLDSDGVAISVGLQLRAQGQRIAVAPRAWISFAPQPDSSFDILRDKQSVRLALLPSWVSWLTVALLPLESVVGAVRQMVLKRPARVLPSLAFGVWFWLTLPRRLREQALLFPSSAELRRSLKTLLASRVDLRLRRTMQRTGNLDAVTAVSQPGFVESGAFWFSLLPLLASMPLLPLGVHAAGLALPPLSPTVTELFTSYLVSPQDAWLLPVLILTGVWPGEPALAFSWLTFLAPTIAYLSSWHLFRAISSNRAGVLVAALTYSLSPILINARLDGYPLTVVSAAVFPWALLGLLKTSESTSSARRWRWSAVTGLLLAISAAMTPLVAVIAVVLASGLFTARKVGVQWLLVVAIPSILILLPRALAYQADIASFFAGWTVTEPASPRPIWNLSIFDWPVDGTLTILALILMATVAQVMRPNIASAAALLLALGALSSPLLIAETAPMANLTAVMLLLASVVGGSLVKTQATLTTLGNFSVVAVLLLAIPALIQPIAADWRQDSRVTPAIVHAASSVDPGVITIALEGDGGELVSEIILGNGTHLDQWRDGGDALLRYQSLPLAPEQQAELAAALAAGSTEEAGNLLREGQVSFVLLKSDDSNLRTNLESSGLLESAGLTEWGRLWRVIDPVTFAPAKVQPNPWVYLSFAVLILYGLLAIPTPGSLRKSRGEASIFVEGDEQ